MNPRHYEIYSGNTCIDDIECDSHAEARELCTLKYTDGEKLRLVHVATNEEVPTA